MYSEKSLALPDDRQAYSRLVALFDNAESGDKFTLDDVAERVRPQRMDSLAFWLSDLARQRVIDQFVQVFSPSNMGGIELFDDLDQVPEMIFDPFQCQEIEVNPTIVRVLFRKHSSEDREQVGTLRHP